jgi:hypothetical protein
MEIATSVNGVPIRLTAERWLHIVDARDDLVGREEDVLTAVRQPDWVTRGYRGSLLAWKGYGKNRFLVVVCKELDRSDGFIITAYFVRAASKRDKVWPR